MNKRNYLLLSVVVTPILVFVWLRVSGSAINSKERLARGQVVEVARIANDNLASLLDPNRKIGGSYSDRFAALRSLYPNAVVDPWGQTLLIACADEKCSHVVVRSFGPNRVDDGGGSDDIVSKK
jgi:hypothetical protein